MQFVYLRKGKRRKELETAFMVLDTNEKIASIAFFPSFNTHTRRKPSNRRVYAPNSFQRFFFLLHFP